MRCLRTPPPFLQPLNEKRVPKPVVLYTPPPIHGRGQKPLITNPQNNNPNSTAMPQIGTEAEQMQGVESDGMARKSISARSIIVNETTNKNVSQEWDEMDQNLNGNNSNMDRNNLDDFRDVEAGVENFGNFGTGQSGINNRNLIEIVNRKLKLDVNCMDGMHAVLPTLSPFNWGRWLEPFGAEVVSLLLNTAEVFVLS